MHFQHFNGNKSSLLYNFYLAAYKVQMGSYPDLVIEDKYPVNLLFNKIGLFFQDFIAPFYIFLRSQFTLNYSKNIKDLNDSELVLNSSSTNSVFNKLRKKIDYRFELNKSGILSFTTIKHKELIEAKCIS